MIMQVGKLFQNRILIVEQYLNFPDVKTFKAYDFQVQRYILVKQVFNSFKQLSDLNSVILFQQKLKHKNILHCYQTLKFNDFQVFVFDCPNGLPIEIFAAKQFNRLKTIESMINPKQLYESIKQFEMSQPDVLNTNFQLQITQSVKSRLKQVNLTDQPLQPCFEVQAAVDYLEYMQITEQQLVISDPTDQQKQSAKQNTLFQSKTIYLNALHYLFQQFAELTILLNQNSDDLQKLIKQQLIQPNNVFVNINCQVKLDLSNILINAAQQSFLAPEFYSNKPSSKYEVFGFGQLLYMLLFGFSCNINTLNFKLDTLQQQKALTMPLTLFGDNYAPHIYIETIQDMLSFDTAKRPSPDSLLNIALQPVESNTISPSPLQGQKQIQSQKSTQSISIKNEAGHKTIKIVILGEYNVGKTTMLKRMALSQQIKPTNMEKRLFVVDNQVFELQFFDTLGTEQNRFSLTNQLYRNVNLCFLVYKLQSSATYDTLELWKKNVENSSEKTIFYIVGNDFGGEKEITEEFDESIKNFIIKQNEDLEKLLIQGVGDCIQKEAWQSEQIKKEQVAIMQVSQENHKKGCC